MKAYRRLVCSFAVAVTLTAIGSTAATAQNALLSGTFRVINAQGNTLQVGGLGTVTFDGAGNWSATFTDNNAGTISSSTASGTYTVAAGGGVTINVGGGGALTGSVSSDGNTLVVGQFVSGQSPEIDVGIKQDGGSYTNNASGALAFNSNTTGTENSAFGSGAMHSNTTGLQNSAFGSTALYSNASGNNNMAFGFQALYTNSTGSYNTAVGTYALTHNLSNGNNAQGYAALFSTTTGSHNTAQGYFALSNNTTGSNNIGIGQNGGSNQTTGSNNIYVGNAGVAAENGVIRIGTTASQTSAFIAGISGNVVTGGTVVVTSSGQLGVASSSRRYKQDVEPLGDASARLYRLRPVKFRYIKADEQGQQLVQFGLIAEEVAKVLPELVYRDAEGKVEGVRYDELTPMLLNEMKHQQTKLETQAQELRDVQQQLAEMRDLNRAMQVALADVLARDTRVALR